MKYLVIVLALALVNSEVIQLPEPRKEGGMPVNEVLAKRKTVREFSDEHELSLEELSQLLWACYGINRPDSGYKTVPSREAKYPFDVYVYLKTGVYLYDPVKHDLTLYLAGDLRAETGNDPWVPDAYAAICLFGVFSRIDYIRDITEKSRIMEIESGFATETMYYVAASEGFNTCVRGNFDKRNLLSVMGFTIQEYYPPLCFSAGR